ncbi:hypothetical protein GQ44DRAFT_768702 [Phaeosphaeriaceae sp. PMI808]|nr:hypothetical protein GQ44DRAFT_768702 [Phaeosphaeriaceae sp. PMI808]
MSFPQRQLATTTRLRQEFAESPSSDGEVSVPVPQDSPPVNRARTIVLLHLAKEALPSEVEAYFESSGFEITRMSLQLNRYNLMNRGHCYIELASEEQAKRAIETLQYKEFIGRPLSVQMINGTFSWVTLNSDGYLTENASEAVKPLIEARRVTVHGQVPFWKNNDDNTPYWKVAPVIIQEHMGKFGIERISRVSRFEKRGQGNLRILATVDFTTKKGADEAVEALHNSKINDRKVQLVITEIAAWAAHQLAKIDPETLATLQEKGLASKEKWVKISDLRDNEAAGQSTDSNFVPKWARGKKHLKLQPWNKSKPEE